MVRRVVELYQRVVGNVRDLADELQIHGDAEAFLAGREQLAHADLQRLYTRAVSHLSRHSQVAEGRLPLRSVDWKVILFGLEGGSTLRESIERVGDCMEAIDGRCGLMSLHVRGERVELRFDTLRQQRSATNCFIDLVGILQFHAELSWLIGQTLPIIEFALDYPAPVYHGLALPPLPFPVQLTLGWSGFALSAIYLDYPVVRTPGERGQTSAPASLVLLDREDMPAETAALPRVRAIAIEELRRNCRLPSFEEIVGQLGCSGATLRRRLAREGSSYREIRNSCRREITLDLLSRTGFSIEEISRRGDFADSDAFRRAFREWTGDTPRSYRAQIRSPLAAE
jgi:AraC-like DNA-binding protein